jgi:hypothetical protein
MDVPKVQWPRLHNTFEVIKKNGRLWIECVETGELVYTMPNFVSINRREDLRSLAELMTIAGHRDIELIMWFETKFKRKS